MARNVWSGLKGPWLKSDKGEPEQRSIFIVMLAMLGIEKIHPKEHGSIMRR